MKQILDVIKLLFKPNAKLSKSFMFKLIVIQAIAGLLAWQFSSGSLIPSPTQIGQKWYELLTSGAMLEDLSASCVLVAEAMLHALIITLIVSYATVMGFFKPFGLLVTKLRFLTVTGLSYLFTIASHGGGYEIKLNLLVFGMTVFFVTSLISILEQTDKIYLNHARTLGFSEWRVVYEVKLLGNVDKIFDVIIQNFAISWTMLTTVEGLVRSGGGIGVALLNQNKTFDLAGVFAFQITVLVMGVLFDYIFNFAKELVCPYSVLTVDKK